jgi:hypothetical protein
MRDRLALALAAVCVTGLACAVAAPAALFAPATRLGPNVIAAEPQPMTGTGDQMKLVANVPMVGDESAPAGSDIELAGDYAFVGSYGEGMVVVDIHDPEHPVRAGLFKCPGGQNDIQLSPDARYAVMAIDTTANACHAGKEGSVVIDIADPRNPKEIAFIPIAVGAHNNTLDWPYLYVDNYPTSYHKLEVFSLESPAAPRKVGEHDYGADSDGVHDSIVDHRPDGRSLLYAASIGNTDVLDVTNPAEPKLLLRFADPNITISHQAEPNFNRSLLLVTDEFLGGLNGTPACGRLPITATLPPVAVATAGVSPLGNLPNPTNIGALWLYALNPDGTVKNGGPDGRVGTFNLPIAAPDEQDRGCTIHVFWQAPDENRLVAAWYGRGTHVVDFADPVNTREVGWFHPTNADTWSAKPHKGYVFTSDINRGMDVLKYVGEDGKRWPATAGPAEIQRQRQQGYRPPVPTGSTPAKAGTRLRTGVYRFSKRVRVPAGASRRGTFTARDSKGKIVSRVPLKLRPGTTRRIRISAGGLEGRYRWTIRAGKRTLAKGRFTVKGKASSRVGLKPGQVLVCKVG